MTNANGNGARVRWASSILVAVFAAGTTLLAMRTSAGFAIAPINPTIATMLAPGQAGAQAARVRQLTQLARSPAALPPIVAEAKRTLAAAPLDHATARTIGMIDLINGQPERGNRLMALVGRATLRDALAHAWLLNRAYAETRWSDVAREANIVMRLDPSMQTTGYSMLNTLVADGRMLPQLAGVLEERPPWRSGFLEKMGEHSSSPANERGLFLLLRGSSAPPTAQELRTWFLVNQSRQSDAMLLANYRLLAPDDFSATERFVRNGDFEGTKAFAPFDWYFYAPAEGAAEITATPEGSGKAMYVEFAGRNQMTVAVQRLTLSSGRYRLRLRTYALTEIVDGTVALSLSCGRSTSTPNLALLPLRGVIGQWQPQSFAVEVPNGCSAPTISVGWRPDGYAEPAQLYIDDVVIAQQQTTTRPTALTSDVPSRRQ